MEDRNHHYDDIDNSSHEIDHQDEEKIVRTVHKLIDELQKRKIITTDQTPPAAEERLANFTQFSDNLSLRFSNSEIGRIMNIASALENHHQSALERDDKSVLLRLGMKFTRKIRQITGLHGTSNLEKAKNDRLDFLNALSWLKEALQEASNSASE